MRDVVLIVIDLAVTASTACADSDDDRPFPVRLWSAISKPVTYPQRRHWTFGIDIDKNVVRRVLLKHYRVPLRETGHRGLSLHRTYQGQPVERRAVVMRVRRSSELLGAGRYGSIYSAHYRVRHSMWRLPTFS